MKYSINQIQAKIASTSQYREKKVEIIQFFNLTNLVENIGLRTLYTSESEAPFYLDKNDLLHIYALAHEKFSLAFNLETFYEGTRPLLTTDDALVKAHTVTTRGDIERVTKEHFETSRYGQKEQAKDNLAQKKKEANMAILEAELAQRRAIERHEFDLASNLTRDFIHNKVVSIDFEFFINKDKSYDVTELGIAMNDESGIKAYHFLIKEHAFKKKNKALQKSFNFGRTEEISEKQIPMIIQMALENAKYVLFHEQREDYEIMNQMNITIPSNITVIDTQLSYKRYFRQKGSAPNGETLENLLTMFDMPYKQLHNAGNDAQMTLELLQKMSVHQQNIEQKKQKKSLKM